MIGLSSVNCVSAKHAGECVAGREFVVGSGKDDEAKQSCSSSGEELRHPQPCHWPSCSSSALWSVCRWKWISTLADLHLSQFQEQANSSQVKSIFWINPGQNELRDLSNINHHAPSAFSEWKLISSASRQSNQSSSPCKVFLHICPSRFAIYSAWPVCWLSEKWVWQPFWQESKKGKMYADWSSLTQQLQVSFGQT